MIAPTIPRYEASTVPSSTSASIRILSPILLLLLSTLYASIPLDEKPERGRILPSQPGAISILRSSGTTWRPG